MNLRWLKGVKAQDKDTVKKEVRAAALVLRRLHDILEEDLQHSIKGMADTANYDCPNWQIKVADSLAYQRTIRGVQQLLKLEEK